jgi:microcystin-dependent protein
MPIDFPTSPTLNQIYNYTGGSDVRFNTSFIYNGSAWEQIKIPIGAIQSFSGFSSPAGWLFCDGTAYSRTIYAALFNTISISTTGNTTISNPTITNIPSTTNMDVGMPISGTNIQSNTKILTINSSTSLTMDKNATASGTGISFVVAPYGVGDGSTTFNIPDLKGRASIGKGTNGTLTKRVLGVGGGDEKITLTINQITSHNHAIAVGNHTHNSFASPTFQTGIQSNDHYHPTRLRWINNEAPNYGLVASGTFVDRVLVDGLAWDYPNPAQPNSSPHVHTFTTSYEYANVSYNSAGSDNPHNNMQPYLPVNYIIKY